MRFILFSRRLCSSLSFPLLHCPSARPQKNEFLFLLHRPLWHMGHLALNITQFVPTPPVATHHLTHTRLSSSSSFPLAVEYCITHKNISFNACLRYYNVKLFIYMEVQESNQNESHTVGVGQLSHDKYSTGRISSNNWSNLREAAVHQCIFPQE